MINIAQHNCEQKEPYKNERAAKFAARGVLANFGIHVYPYRCSICHNFHLTKKTKEKKNRKKEIDIAISNMQKQIKDSNIRIQELEQSIRAARVSNDKVAISKLTISLEQTKLFKYDIEDRKKELTSKLEEWNK